MKSFYFFIGTKAQAIKSQPLMSKMDKVTDLNVVLVDSGQHFLLTEKIFDTDNFMTLKLHTSTKNISTYLSGFLWILKFIIQNIILKKINNSEMINQTQRYALYMETQCLLS